MTSKPTQAALCSSVSCWYVSYLSFPPALSVVPLPAEVTDSALNDSSCHFHCSPRRHHRSAAMNAIPRQSAYHHRFTVFSVRSYEDVKLNLRLMGKQIMQQYYIIAKRNRLHG